MAIEVARRYGLGMLPMEMTDLMFARQASKDGRAAELRRGAGFSQQEIAQAVDVSGPTVSRWERGARKPHGVAAERYGRLLQELATRGLEAGD